MLRNLVITKLSAILEKIPYRTKFGLSLADELKYLYYDKIGQFKQPHRCLCGGNVYMRGIPPDGWELSCIECDQMYDED